MRIGLQTGLLEEFMASNAGIDDDMAVGAACLFLTNLWGIICAGIYGRMLQLLREGRKAGEFQQVYADEILRKLLML